MDAKKLLIVIAILFGVSKSKAQIPFTDSVYVRTTKASLINFIKFYGFSQCIFTFSVSTAWEPDNDSFRGLVEYHSKWYFITVVNYYHSLSGDRIDKLKKYKLVFTQKEIAVSKVQLLLQHPAYTSIRAINQDDLNHLDGCKFIIFDASDWCLFFYENGRASSLYYNAPDEYDKYCSSSYPKYKILRSFVDVCKLIGQFDLKK